jgi:cation diffusion facilitator family transporter
VGLAVNTALSALKIAAGLLGHSEALVADGVESLADVVSSVVVWRAVVVAAQPPDQEHPYGHGKAEAVASVVVGLMLLGAAGWIVVHAMASGGDPRQQPRPFTLVVLVSVIVLKEVLFRYVRRVAKEVQSLVVQSDAWHHRSDALTSLAAGIGITIALLGGPDYRSADSIAAVLASGVIAWNGWTIMARAFDELMDASPEEEVVAGIRRLAGVVPGVELVEKCIVRRTGGSLLVDMHVHVHGDMSVNEAHRIAHEVKNAVRAGMPEVMDVLVHLEPARFPEGPGAR